MSVPFIRSRVEQSMQVYEKSLRDAGFKVIGSGAFATVYKHPSNKDLVVKVGEMNGYGSGGSNDPYIEYVKQAAKYPDNPWFPKIHSVEICTPRYRHNKRYFVVVLERLTASDRPTFEMRELLSRPRPTLIELKASLRPDFVCMLEVLQSMFKRFDRDLHAGNILFRDKQPVISDPVC